MVWKMFQNGFQISWKRNLVSLNTLFITSAYQVQIQEMNTKRLKEFPVKPDVIILQYFPNDIEKVGREKGLSLSGTAPYADLKGPDGKHGKKILSAKFHLLAVTARFVQYI